MKTNYNVKLNIIILFYSITFYNLFRMTMIYVAHAIVTAEYTRLKWSVISPTLPYLYLFQSTITYLSGFPIHSQQSFPVIAIHRLQEVSADGTIAHVFDEVIILLACNIYIYIVCVCIKRMHTLFVSMVYTCDTYNEVRYVATVTESFCQKRINIKCNKSRAYMKRYLKR